MRGNIQIREARPEEAEVLAAAQRRIAAVPGRLASTPAEIHDDAVRERIARLQGGARGKFLVATQGEEIVAHAAERPGVSCPIATVSTREDVSDFSMQVRFVVNWHKNPHESGSKISLGLIFDHSVPQLRRVEYYEVMPGGAVHDADEMSAIGVADIIQRIDAFLLEPSHHI